MPHIGHIERTLLNATGVPLALSSLTIYREAGTVNGAQSGTSPLTVTVHSPGKLKASDTVFLNTTTGTTYNVDSVTDTTVVLSGFAGTLVLADLDAIVPSNNLPTLYDNNQAVGTVSNPLTTDANGYADAYAEYGEYEAIASGGDISTPFLIRGLVAGTESPGQLRYTSSFARGSSTGGIVEAIADLPSGGGTVVISEAVTAAAAISIPADVEVRGQGAFAKVTKGFNGTLFTLAGARAKIIGVNIDANKASFTGIGILASAATDVVIRECTVANANTIGIQVTGGSHRAHVIRNRVTGCTLQGIVADDGADDFLCRGNYVSSTTGSGGASECIAVVPHAGGSTDRPIIENNTCVIGVTTSGGIEVFHSLGAGNADSPVGVIIRGNTVIAAASGCFGISVGGDGALGGIVEGNYVDSLAFDIDWWIEVAGSRDFVVSGNVGTGTGAITNGILITGSIRTAVTSNVLSGFDGNSVVGSAIYNGSSTVNAVCDNCLIADNVIVVNSTGPQYGIQVQTNATGVSCLNTAVRDNLVVGVTGASSYGIRVINNTGTLDGTTVMGNRVSGWATGVEIAAASEDETSVLNNDLRGNTAAYTDNNTSTTRAWGNIIAANQLVALPIASTQNITAAATTLVIKGDRLLLTADNSYTISNAPTLADGLDGQVVEIMNVDTTDTITLQDQGTLPSSNLRLGAATRALAPRDSLLLRFDSTIDDWVELRFSNVV